MTEAQLTIVIAAIFYRTSPVRDEGRGENKIDERWALRAATDFIEQCRKGGA